MKPKLPQLEPPLISALLSSIHLIEETAELYVDNVRAARDKLELSVDQNWRFNAAFGEQGDRKPNLTIDCWLNVAVSDKDSQQQVGTFRNHSRAAFDVIGVVGDMPANELPPRAVEPYLIFVAERVRTRCHNSFNAMLLSQVRIGSPRGFIVTENATEARDNVKPKARRKRKKRQLEL